MIKKFKNGNITIRFDKDYTNIDEFYGRDMFWNDLYINQINGYEYLVDFNTQLVYELGSCLMQNPLKEIEDIVKEQGSMKLHPLSKKDSKSLLQDLENGF